MKKCAKCDVDLLNKRSKFCSTHCKWWYNAIKRENESHLPPVKKRNNKFFYMTVGSGRAKSNSRQGKRSGGMVMGSMSAMIQVTIDEIVELNQEIRLCDQTIIKKSDVKNILGFEIK